MRLEDYFLFLSPDEIQIKGTGVAIEKILYPYLFRGETPEAIAARFPTVRVEHAYATITYYYNQQQIVEAYFGRWLERERAREEEQQAQVPEKPARTRKAHPARPASFPSAAPMHVATSLAG